MAKKKLKEYYIPYNVSFGVTVVVQAYTLEEAIRKAEHDIDDCDYDIKMGNDNVILEDNGIDYEINEDNIYYE